MQTSWCVSESGGDRKTYLDELVPAGGDNDGVLGVGAEADARNPLGVALLGDGELAVTEGVPELDGAIAGTGDDLTVVGGEADGENVVGVADETAGGGAGGKLPETEGLVPRGREGVGTVGRDHLCRANQSNCPRYIPRYQHDFPPPIRVDRVFSTYTVGDDVRVAVETALGVAVRGLIAGEVPDDEGLVSATRKEHVGANCERAFVSS